LARKSSKNKDNFEKIKKEMTTKRNKAGRLPMPGDDSKGITPEDNSKGIMPKDMPERLLKEDEIDGSAKKDVSAGSAAEEALKGHIGGDKSVSMDDTRGPISEDKSEGIISKNYSDVIRSKDNSIEVKSEDNSYGTVSNHISDGILTKDTARTGNHEKEKEYEHVVVFRLDKQEYAINIGNVREISRIDGITRLPMAPYFIDGMVDLRGEIIPIMNLRKVFGMQSIYTYSDEKILVVEYGNRKIGMLTDHVSEVTKIPYNNLEDAPEIYSEGKKNNYIYKIAKLNNNMRTVMILDIPVLLEFM